MKHKQELQALRAELSKAATESKSGARVKETAQKEVEGLRKKARRRPPRADCRVHALETGLLGP